MTALRELLERVDSPGRVDWRHSQWAIVHCDRDNRAIWSNTHGALLRPFHWDSPARHAMLSDPDSYQPNMLVDQGEQEYLEEIYRAGAAIATFYGRLWQDTIAETDTLSDLLGEPVGNGYDPTNDLAWARGVVDFPTIALDAGDYQTTGLERTVAAAGGSIGPVNLFTFSDVPTITVGLLIFGVALSQERTLADGETLRLQPKIKQQ